MGLTLNNVALLTLDIREMLYLDVKLTIIRFNAMISLIFYQDYDTSEISSTTRLQIP